MMMVMTIVPKSICGVYSLHQNIATTAYKYKHTPPGRRKVTN